MGGKGTKRRWVPNTNEPLESPRGNGGIRIRGGGGRGRTRDNRGLRKPKDRKKNC